MNTATKWILGIVVIAVIVWIGMSMSDKAPAETGPIKIGSVLPLTGDAAVYGEPGRNIMELAVKEINAAGGVDGRMLEIIYEDGKCSGPDAASAAQKLINIDGVKIIIGGFCSGESLAIEPITTAAGVFLFSPGSSSPDLTGVSQMFARNYPSDAGQGETIADIAYNDKKLTKVAIIQEQTDYSVGLYNSFNTPFTALGGTVVREEFASTQTDFRTPLTKLKANNPDALFLVVQTPAAGQRILQQVQDLGWDVPLLISDILPGDATFVAQNATRLEGAIGAEFGVDPNNQKFQALLTSYKNAYGTDMPFQSYGQTEYDSVYMIRDAIAAVGYDAEKVADWMRGLNGWTGASGTVNIGENGDRTRGHVGKVIRQGKTELY
jgi:branched-chain amino acid transport system substrate-binding protein